MTQNINLGFLVGMRKKMYTPLKNARVTKGLTLNEVAHLVCSDAGNLSRIENGKQIPNKELISKLVDLFKDLGITELHILYPEKFREKKD